MRRIFHGRVGRFPADSHVFDMHTAALLLIHERKHPPIFHVSHQTQIDRVHVSQATRMKSLAARRFDEGKYECAQHILQWCVTGRRRRV